MGKRADDLKLDDTLIPDDRDTPWYKFMGEIDDLLATGRYDWAADTLAGIRETVEKTRRVSEGQKRAVANIETRGESQRGGSRRYEGFEGRRGW